MKKTPNFSFFFLKLQLSSEAWILTFLSLSNMPTDSDLLLNPPKLKVLLRVHSSRILSSWLECIFKAHNHTRGALAHIGWNNRHPEIYPECFLCRTFSVYWLRRENMPLCCIKLLFVSQTCSSCLSTHAALIYSYSAGLWKQVIK